MPRERACTTPPHAKLRNAPFFCFRPNPDPQLSPRWRMRPRPQPAGPQQTAASAPGCSQARLLPQTRRCWQAQRRPPSQEPPPPASLLPASPAAACRCHLPVPLLLPRPGWAAQRQWKCAGRRRGSGLRCWPCWLQCWARQTQGVASEPSCERGLPELGRALQAPRALRAHYCLLRVRGLPRGPEPLLLGQAPGRQSPVAAAGGQQMV